MIRALNAVALVAAAALAVALYIAKTQAQGAQERLESLQAQLAEERRQINVLSVEIAHLEDPERLRDLARRHLGFEPLDPAREMSVADLPRLRETETKDEEEGLAPRLAAHDEIAMEPR